MCFLIYLTFASCILLITSLFYVYDFILKLFKVSTASIGRNTKLVGFTCAKTLVVINAKMIMSSFFINGSLIVFFTFQGNIYRFFTNSVISNPIFIIFQSFFGVLVFFPLFFSKLNAVS